MKRPAAAFTRKRIAGKFAGKFAAKRTSGKVKGTLIVRVRCLDSDDERKEKKNAKGLYIIPFRRIEMMEDATVKQLECRLLELDLGYMAPPQNYQLFNNGLVLGVVRGDTFAAIADDNTRSKTLKELGLHQRILCACDCHALMQSAAGGIEVHLFRARKRYADMVYEELLKALSIVEDPSSWPRAHDAWVKKLCSVVELEPLKQLCETFDIDRQSSSSKPKIINLILQNINIL